MTPSELKIPDTMADLLRRSVLESEVEPILTAIKGIHATYSLVASAPEVQETEEKLQRLDQEILKALTTLAGLKIKQPLKKLAWVAYAVSEAGLCCRIYDRIAQADFLLTEFKDIQAHKGEQSWRFMVLVDGKPRYAERTFPFWEIEVENELDNPLKTLAWYRVELVKRQILK